MEGLSLFDLGLAEAVFASLRQGGWVLLPIFLAGFAAWIFIVDRWLSYRFLRFPFRKFWDNLRKGLPLEQALEESSSRALLRQGGFARIAATLFREEKNGIVLMQRLEEERHLQNHSLSAHLRTIAVLGALAPLLGLLGTVSGMVHTFDSITRFGFGNPVLLADGISESLLTTQAGLVMAFPVVLLHNWLRSRADELKEESELHGRRLVDFLLEKKSA